MLLSFITTRIVLEALGVVDYGIVNAVSGVVSMFSFVTSTLSSGCSRYFSIDIGSGMSERLTKTFSLVLVMYVFVAMVLAVVAETIGLWYVYAKLVYPANRMVAVICFFHATVFMMVMNVIAIPYSAIAISYEDISLFSFLSISDAVGKLLIGYCIKRCNFDDTLITFGVLMGFLSLLQTGGYIALVRIKYRVCRFVLYWNSTLCKEMFAFNGWSLFGTMSWMTSETLVNLLLNSYFGPVVNAAKSVASQVFSGVNSLANNFQVAARPQIVKEWAANNKAEFYVLVKVMSKVSFALLLLPAIPLLVATDAFLDLWLKRTPEYAVVFTQLTVVMGIINVFSFVLCNAAQAIGRLGLFEGLGSGMRLLTFPAAWMALQCGCDARWVLVIACVVTALCVASRFVVLFNIGELPKMDYIKNVIIRLIMVFVFAVILGRCVVCMIPPCGLLYIIVDSAIMCVSGFVVFVVFGLTAYERHIVYRHTVRYYDKIVMILRK